MSTATGISDQLFVLYLINLEGLQITFDIDCCSAVVEVDKERLSQREQMTHETITVQMGINP